MKQGRRLETFSGYETGCARRDRLFLVRPTLEYVGNANLVDRESVLMRALGRGSAGVPDAAGIVRMNKRLRECFVDHSEESDGRAGNLKRYDIGDCWRRGE